MELKKQGVKNFEVTAMLDWLVDPLLNNFATHIVSL
jgi:hypothetical protein